MGTGKTRILLMYVLLLAGPVCADPPASPRVQEPDTNSENIQSLLLVEGSEAEEETPNSEEMRADLFLDNFFQLVVPASTTVCGVWNESRDLRTEYHLLTQVDLVPGTILLPLDYSETEADLIEELRFGPDRVVGVPQARGRFFPSTQGNSYRFEQPFLVGSIPVTLRMESLFYSGSSPVQTMDERFITDHSMFYGGADLGGPYEEFLQYASCSYSLLPLWNIDVRLEGGRRVFLQLRHQPPMAGSGPARLVFGQAWLSEGDVVQNDYWKLVYSAEHHNWNEKFWILFDEPLGEVHGIGISEHLWPTTHSAEFLDRDLNPLRELEVVSYMKTQATAAFSGFRLR